MKKILFLLVVILLIAAVGFGDSTFESSIGSTVSQGYQREYKNLSNAMAKAGSLSDVRKYLAEWSREHEFAMYSDVYDNVVILKGASPGFEKEDTTILHCSFALDPPESHARSIAAALFALAYAENHGSLELLLTSDKTGDMQGAKKINGQYLVADRLVNLDNRIDNTVIGAAVGACDYSLTKKIRWAAPTLSKAFEITIDGLDVSSASPNAAQNPIKALCGIIFGAKGEGVKLELAAINGGSALGQPPSVATVTVLIDDDDVGRFAGRVAAAKAKYMSSFGESNPGLTYRFEEVQLPAKVVSEEDFASITGLIYMVPDGVVLAAENGAPVAASSLGTVSTYTGNFAAGISARSLSEDKMAELSESIKTICWLSNTACSEQEISSAAADGDALARELSALLEESQGAAVAVENYLNDSEWAVLKNRSQSMDAASICVSGEKPQNAVKALLRFLNSRSF
ncbi:MAG: hypothetical protein FWG53_02960 [Clostridiales bacterium]|nr:hypothetical protein [Clostridiales bacterium]